MVRHELRRGRLPRESRVSVSAKKMDPSQRFAMFMPMNPHPGPASLYRHPRSPSSAPCWVERFAALRFLGRRFPAVRDCDRGFLGGSRRCRMKTIPASSPLISRRLPARVDSGVFISRASRCRPDIPPSTLSRRCRIMALPDGRQHFHAMVDVARHQVGAADVNLSSPPLRK